MTADRLGWRSRCRKSSFFARRGSG